MSELVDDIRTEADLCRNEGANDIAALLEQCAAEIEALQAQVAALTAELEAHKNAPYIVYAENVRADALEEAALLADRIASNNYSMHNHRGQQAGEQIARGIRGLINPPSQDTA